MSTLTLGVRPATAAERLPLPGGRAVLLRPVVPQDAAAEQAFVSEGLSLDSRHKRFHIGLRQLPPELLRRFTEVDHEQHVALVAQDEATGALVADARYVLSDSDASQAEFAIAVADAWQSLGLGRALMARLSARARSAGLSRLYGDVLVQNRRMIVLMRGLGAAAQPHPDGPQMVRIVFEL